MRVGKGIVHTCGTEKDVQVLVLAVGGLDALLCDTLDWRGYELNLQTRHSDT